MSRERLPNRRGGETVEFSYGEGGYVLTAGRFPDGRIGEMFGHHRKPGSALDAIVADAAVLASLLLQNGMTPTDIAARLGRTSDGQPASIIGALANELAKIEVGS